MGYRRLGFRSDHRRALLRNSVTSLLEHEKITTTETRAKEISSIAEKMITLAKTGGLHARRQAMSFVVDQRVTDKLFAEIGPRYAERHGGYTRIVKIGLRVGDGASMVQLELVK